MHLGMLEFSSMLAHHRYSPLNLECETLDIADVELSEEGAALDAMFVYYVSG